MDFTVINVPILNGGCRFKSSSVSDGESDIRVDTAQTDLQVLGIEVWTWGSAARRVWSGCARRITRGSVLIVAVRG